MKTLSFIFSLFLDNDSHSSNTFFSLEFIQNDVRYLYEVVLKRNAVVSE